MASKYETLDQRRVLMMPPANPGAVAEHYSSDSAGARRQDDRLAPIQPVALSQSASSTAALAVLCVATRHVHKSRGAMQAGRFDYEARIGWFAGPLKCHPESTEHRWQCRLH